ncbi:anthrone oxygenase family protein [Streptomyces sp. NPDC006510]|uniref:anthrone oxygenase family protein n=1 Tax=Streptomyces sp. NPDC006510 TaxID=3155600 RepID=UPI0033B578CA
MSVIGVGLMAGLFFAFDVSAVPGLARTDDRLYAEAMQNFNKAMDTSGLFVLVFLGALAVTVAVAVIEYRKGRRTVALRAGAAAALHVVALLVTFSVDIPLNNELAAIGDPAKARDLSVVDEFKGIWETTDIMRTLLCSAALGCLAHCLKLHGRGTPVS